MSHYVIEDGDSGLAVLTGINDNFAELYSNSIVVNVKYYGATGDGVTDDYAAIQEAIGDPDYHSVQIGDVVTETYLLSQPLIIPSNKNITIRGTLKIQDSEETTLTVDVSAGDSSITVVDSSIFDVGQQIGITDDDGGGYKLYETLRGWTGTITDITDSVITLDSQSTYSYVTTKNARAAHAQSVIVVSGESNIKISGNGVIDGNESNQVITADPATGYIQIHPSRGYPSAIEDQKVACSLVIYNSDNVVVDGLEVKNGLLHNFSVTGIGSSTKCTNILLRNITCYNGHDKNFLIRFTDNVRVDNVTTYGASWEDGVIFYSSVNYAVVSNLISYNNKRYGVCWNSSYNKSGSINNVTTYGNYEYGLAIHSEDVNVSNVVSNDPCSISAAWVAENVNITNLNLIDVDTDNHLGDSVLRLLGGLDRVNITNLIIDGCSGVAIEAKAISTNVPENTHIAIGGVYNHTGTVEDLVAGTDITYTAFNK